jgi:hypothetical protein
MRYEPVDSIYVIREVSTGKLVKFGTKGGWISVRAAKNAFNLHMKWHFGKDWSEGKGLFDEQDQFVIEGIE